MGERCVTIELNKFTIWIIGTIWLIVPILSWLGALATLYYFYKKLIIMLQDIIKTFEQMKEMSEQLITQRIETKELKQQAEEELKAACQFYNKITNLLDKK